MKLLFDQNLSPRLVNRLDLYPDSQHVFKAIVFKAIVHRRGWLSLPKNVPSRRNNCNQKRDPIAMAILVRDQPPMVRKQITPSSRANCLRRFESCHPTGIVVLSIKPDSRSVHCGELRLALQP
nr:MAG: hypothetical protein EDM05_12630 [Leptolyngbya sp. IPPAS B-1204]